MNVLHYIAKGTFADVIKVRDFKIGRALTGVAQLVG